MPQNVDLHSRKNKEKKYNNKKYQSFRKPGGFSAHLRKGRGECGQLEGNSRVILVENILVGE